jgi:[ribosomal protein S5]-alanine N-acetyltransferase
MNHLRLLPIELAMDQALAEGSDAFSTQFGVDVEDLDLVQEVVTQNLIFLDQAPRPAPWGAYLGVDNLSLLAIGTCAFKAAPSEDGTVEIAYFTFPLFEGSGYATAMAKALIELAQAQTSARCVIAHTLPAASASTRVLEKAGMRFVGAVVDPEDGNVWRWEHPLRR